MKLIVKIFFLIVISLNIAANNCPVIHISVPFQEILIKPNCSLQANYSFGLSPIIFCFVDTTDNVNIGKVTWTFKGQIKSGTIPLFLTNNPDFEGQFADSNGIITIKNNFTSGIAVNCLFGF